MEIKPNTVVTFHYTVKDKETGEVYDSSIQRRQPPKGSYRGKSNNSRFGKKAYGS